METHRDRQVAISSQWIGTVPALPLPANGSTTKPFTVAIEGRCGYNLTGSESNRCPECGTLFIEAGVTLGNPSPKRARWVLVSLIVLSILFVGGIGLSVSYRAASQARAQAARAQFLRMRAVEMQATLLRGQQQESSEQAEANSKSDP